MESRWNFPANGNGQMRGWNEAGIQTFTGNKIAALARETCQKLWTLQVMKNLM